MTFDVNYEIGAQQAEVEERREGDVHEDYVDAVVFGDVPDPR